MSAEEGGNVPPEEKNGSNSSMPLEITENTRLELTTLNSPYQHFARLVRLPAADGFLLSSDDGQLSVISVDEGEGQTHVENTAAYGRPSHAAFNPRHGALVLSDEAGWVGIRRADPSGFHALRTQLPASPDGQSLAQHHLVSIEMSKEEGAEWINYFKSPMPGKEAGVFQLCSQLPAIIEKTFKEVDADGNAGGDSLVMKLPWRKLLIPLLRWTHAMESKVGGGGGEAIFSPAFSLLERMRLQALPHDPYGSGATSRGSYALRQSGAVSRMRSLPRPTRCRVEKFQLNVEAARRLTFHRWPHMDFKWALPQGMAEAGFYHHPVDENDDRVLCFTCSLCLVSWEPSDEPRQEHERHSSTCPYINGDSGHNVPLGITMAHLAPIQCGNECGPIVRGTFTSDADWFVVGYGTTDVSCLHLDRVVQEPLTFTIALEAFERQVKGEASNGVGVELTALCCLGSGAEARSLLRPTISAALVVGIIATERDTRAVPAAGGGIFHGPIISEEVSSLNTLNATLGAEQEMAAISQADRRRNYLLLYHIIELEESESADKPEGVEAGGNDGKPSQPSRTRRPTGGGMVSVKAKFADRKRRRAAPAVTASAAATEGGGGDSTAPAVGSVDWKKTSEMMNALQGVAEAVSNLPSQGSDVGAMLKGELAKIKTLGQSLDAELKNQQTQLDAIASQLTPPEPNSMTENYLAAMMTLPAGVDEKDNEDTPMELGDEPQPLPVAATPNESAITTTTTAFDNEKETSLPEINYAPFNDTTVAMQSIPLPAPFHCAESFRMEHIVADDTQVVVAVNRIDEKSHPPSSALLVYSRIGRVNMIEEQPVSVQQHPFGPISKLLLLPVVAEGPRPDSSSRLGLAAVKLSDGSAKLLDLSTGESTPIDVGSDVADIAGENTNNNGYTSCSTLHVLTTDQVVHTLHISQLHRPRVQLCAGATPTDVSKLLSIIAEAGNEKCKFSLDELEERISMKLYDQPVEHLHWLKRVLRENWLAPSAIINNDEHDGKGISTLWEATRAKLSVYAPPPSLHGTHHWREEKGQRGLPRRGVAFLALPPATGKPPHNHVLSHCNRSHLVCQDPGESNAHVIQLGIGEESWHSLSHVNVEVKTDHKSTLQLSVYAVDTGDVEDEKAALAEYNTEPAKLKERGSLVKGPLLVELDNHNTSASFVTQLSPLEAGPTAKSIYILLEKNHLAGGMKSIPLLSFEESEVWMKGPIELIATAHSYAAPSTPEASLTRLLLLNRADLHEVILKCASRGSDRIGQTQCLDVLLWLQAHKHPMTLPTNSSDIENLLMDAHGGAPRELAHKWTVLLANELPRIESVRLSKWLNAFTSLLSGDRNLPQLSSTAGSFHWLCTLLFQLIRVSSITPLDQELLPSINALLADSSSALLKLGEEWRGKVGRLLNSPSETSLGSMALVFDERLVDYPNQVLALGTGVLGGDVHQRPIGAAPQPIPTLPAGQPPPSLQSAHSAMTSAILTHAGGASTAAATQQQLKPFPPYTVLPAAAIYQAPSGLSAGASTFGSFPPLNTLPPAADYYYSADYAGGGAAFDDIFYIDGAEMGGSSNAVVSTGAPAGTYTTHTYSNVVHPPSSPPSSSSQGHMQIVNPTSEMDIYLAPAGYTTVAPTFTAPYHHPPILPPSGAPSTSSAFGVGKTAAWPGKQISKSGAGAGAYTSAANTSASSAASRQSAISALPCREHVAEEIDWKQMILAGSIDPATTPTTQDKHIQRLLLSTQDHWIGLAEVEPLDFQCAYGSDHMKLLWVETGACAPLPTAPSPAPPGAEPSMELNGSKQTGTRKQRFSSEDADGEELSMCAEESHRKRCQDYLVKRHLDCTMAARIQQSKAPSALPKPSIMLQTAHHSSAPAITTTAQRQQQQPWPLIQLVADRMTAGSRKQVVLDFGQLVLLTDALFPACEYTSQLQVDVWCVDEKEDGFKLVPSTKAISERSIVMTPIEPGLVVRFMRLTYTSKQLYDKPCSIPIGRFFGLKSPSAWQLMGAVNGEMMRESVANTEARTSHVSQMLEMARTRYAKSCARFKESWAKAGQSPALLPLYRPLHAQCYQDRLALHHGLTELQRLGGGKSEGRADVSASLGPDGWGSASIDQVRMVSTSLMLLLNQIYPLLSITGARISPLPASDNNLMEVDSGQQPLTLSSATSLFAAFCLHPSTTPAMRWQCCRYLLFYGGETTWWAGLFPHLLQTHFTKANFTGEEGFLLLTHLCTQTPSKQVAVVVEKLLHFLLEQLAVDGGGNGDPTLLSWGLQLLSCLLDFHNSTGGRTNGIVGDSRWAFLLGDMALTGSGGRGQGSSVQQPSSTSIFPRYSTPQVAIKTGGMMSSTPGSYAFAASKAHYKKLLEQLQKLEAGEAASQAKIEKLKLKLQSLKALFPKTSAGTGPSSSTTVASAYPFSSTPNLTAHAAQLVGGGTVQILSKALKKKAVYQPPPGFAALIENPLKHQHSFSAPSIPPLQSGGGFVGSCPTMSPNINFASNTPTNSPLGLGPEVCSRFAAECLRAVGGLEDGREGGRRQLPLATKLLVMKVVAQVVASGPSTPVDLEAALGREGFIQLLSSVLAESDVGGSWVKHALLCMLLEVGEAEMGTSAVAAEVPAEKASTEGIVATDSTSSIAWRLVPLSTTATVPAEGKPAAAAQLAEQLVSPNAIEECAISAVSSINAGVPPADGVESQRQSNMSKSMKLERQLRERTAATSGPAMVDVVGCEALLKGRLGYATFEECRRLSTLKNALGKTPAATTGSKNTRARFELEANASPTATPNWHSAFTALHSLMADRFPSSSSLDGDERGTFVDVGFPERLLAFYWQLHAQIPLQLHSRSPIPAASKECARALLSLCSNYPLMDEVLWCHALRLLNYSLQTRQQQQQQPTWSTSPLLVRELEKCEDLNRTLARYLLHQERISGAGMGPAVDEHFLLFVQQLLCSPSSLLMDRMIDVVCEVLPGAAMLWGAMDVLVGFTEKLLAEATHLTDYCSDAKVAALHSVLLGHTKELVAGRVKRDPSSSARGGGNVLPGGAGSSINVCFNQAADTEEQSSNTETDLIDFSTEEAPSVSASASSSYGGGEEAAKGKGGEGGPTWLRKALITSPAQGSSQTDPSGSAARCIGYEKRHRNGGFGGSGRGAPPGTTHSLCSGKEGHETVVGNLMKLTSTWMLERPAICRQMLENNHQAIYDAIDTLFNSRLAISCNTDASINFDQWRVTSLADLTLYTLLLLAHSIREDGLKILLKLVIYHLRQRHGMSNLHKMAGGGGGDEQPLELSGPIALLLGRMLDEMRMRDVWIELGGHLLIAEQLQRSISICTNSQSWPSPHSSPFPVLQRQLHSVMASQRGEDGPLPYVCSPPHTAINYAPLCQLSSSSPTAYQLQLLTSAVPASRRTASRQPQWTYHFQPQQQWVDIVFHLPHPVLVTDVVVKPHQPVLSSAPSALQVELSFSTAPDDWLPACPLLTTSGLCKVRIPIRGVSGDGSGTLARAVRLRLKRPLESATLQLQQVSIMGHSTISFGSSTLHQRHVLGEWLGIFNRVCSALPVWSYAPHLPAALTQLFLQEPNPRETCSLLHSVLLNVDSAGEEGKEAQSVVKLIVQHVLAGRPTCYNSMGLTLAELLLLLCSEGDKAAIRQKQLIEGVKETVLSQEAEELLPTLLWTSACILWANCSDETPLRYDTLTLCLESGAKMMREIAAISLSSRASATPAAWFLCSLLRATPHLAGELLAFYDQCHHQPPLTSSGGADGGEQPPAAASVFKAIGRAFQSLPAVDYLLDQQLLSKWIQRGLALAAPTGGDYGGEELPSLVDCLNQLAVMRPVVSYLESAEGGRFLAQLLRLIAMGEPREQLSKSTLELVKKCVAVGGNVHRQRTAKLLCELLKSCPGRGGKGELPSPLRTLIHELVLVDERVVVKVAHPTSATTPSEASTTFKSASSHPFLPPSKGIEELMLHPPFGCRNSDRVVELSLYTKCKELIPVNVGDLLKKSHGPRRSRPRAYYSTTTNDDVLWPSDVYGGGNAEYYGYYGYTDDDFYPAPGGDYWHSGMPYSATYSSGSGGGVGFHQSSSSAPLQQSANATAGSSASPTAAQSVPMLYCDVLSPIRPVDEEWTLAELMERIQVTQAANRGVGSPNIWSGSKDPLEGRFSLSLQLCSVPVGGSIETDWGSASADSMPTTPPTTVSTLQHFAKEGGLLELAHHFPIHKAIERLARSGDALVAQVGRLRTVPSTGWQTTATPLPTTSSQWGFAGMAPTSSSASTNINSRSVPLLAGQVKEQKYALEAAVNAALAELGQTTDHTGGRRQSTEATVHDQHEVQLAASTMTMATTASEVGVDEGGESAEAVINTLLDEVQHLQSVVMQSGDDPLLPTMGEEDEEAMDYSEEGGETPQVLYAGEPMPAAVIEMGAGGDGEGGGTVQNDFEWLDWPPLPPSGISTTTGNTTTYHFVSYVPADAVGPDGSVPLSTLLSGLVDSAVGGGQISAGAYGRNDTTSSSKTLQPYVLLALSLFLRLDGYAELMVTRDRTKAKQLIGAAFGTTGDSAKAGASTDAPVELRPSYTQPSFSNVNSSTRHKKSSEDAKKKRLGFKSAKSFSIDASSSSSSKMKGKKSAGGKHFIKYLQPNTIPTVAFDPWSSPGETLLQQSAASPTASTALPLFPFKVLSTLLSDSGEGRPRREALASGVMSLVLECLSHFAHQQPETSEGSGEHGSAAMAKVVRRVLEAEVRLEALRNSIGQVASGAALGAPQLPAQTAPSTSTQSGGATSQQQQQNYWAKGTGFGHGTTQQQWNIRQHEAKRRWDEEMVVALLEILCAYITGGAEVEAEFAELLATSCLAKTVHAQLLNDSVLDISKHAHVCESVVSVVLALAKSTFTPDYCELHGDEGKQPLFRVLGTGGGRTESPRLLAQLKQLSHTIDIYLSRLNSTGGDGGVAEGEGGTDESDGEERLERLSKLSKEAADVIERKLGAILAANTPAGHTDSAAVSTVEEAGQSGQLVLSDALYCSEMKTLQFDTIPFNFPSTSSSASASQLTVIPYHYNTSLATVGQSGTVKRSRRLAQEIVTLNSSLPLTLSSSVFARSAEERLDVMKMLITGPADTPYANGCFEFDVYFPADFPQQPMQINLETTGNHSVRFNPNLYDDGKVCLSILNTWRGRPEERWNPESSSLLQVIVSIQSLILVNDPYFNEPGYERWRGTPAGTQASREYDANIRQQTVRWAMTEMLRHPPKAFDDVVRRHFWLKRDEICEQVEAWIAEMQSIIDSYKLESSGAAASMAATTRTFSSYLSGLKKNFAQLKEEFAKMKPPPGLERLQSKRFPAGGASSKRGGVGSEAGKRKSPPVPQYLSSGLSGLDALFTPADQLVSTLSSTNPAMQETSTMEVEDYDPAVADPPNADADPPPHVDADTPEMPIDYLAEEDKSQATTEEGDESEQNLQWEESGEE